MNDKTFSEPTITVLKNENSKEIPAQETSCTYSAGKHHEATFLLPHKFLIKEVMY